MSEIEEPLRTEEESRHQFETANRRFQNRYLGNWFPQIFKISSFFLHTPMEE